MQTVGISTLDHIRDNVEKFLLINGCIPEDVEEFMKNTYTKTVSWYIFDTTENFRLILSMRINDKYKSSNITTPIGAMSKTMENKFVYISGNINFMYRNFIIPKPSPGSSVTMFTESEMKYDVMDHFLQPEIKIFRRGKHHKFFKDYEADIPHFSQVQITDPVSRRLLANIGDVIEYSTYSKSSGKKEFRVVIPERKDNL